MNFEDIDQELFLKIKQLIKEHTDTKSLKDIRAKYPSIFDAAFLDCMKDTQSELKTEKN